MQNHDRNSFFLDPDDAHDRARIQENIRRHRARIARAQRQTAKRRHDAKRHARGDSNA